MRVPGTAIGRRRNLVVLLLWAAAVALILVQGLAMHISGATEGGYLKGNRFAFHYVPADWWRMSGTLGPLALMALALLLQTIWWRWVWRWLSVIALVLLVPVAAIATLIALAYGPERINSVQLPSGRQFVFAIEPVLTDNVYSLYQPIGPFGFWWRQAGDLDYSEDGRFTDNARLAISPDHRWLLVGRGGIWTDCFRLVNEMPVRCDSINRPSWTDADYEQAMRAQSARFARLTGMTPPR